MVTTLVLSWSPRAPMVLLCPLCMLAGTDVTRKVITLARECGAHTEMPGVDTESLVPPELSSCGAAQFMERLPEVLMGVGALAWGPQGAPAAQD